MESHNGTESGDKSDQSDMDEISSVNESIYEPMHKDMLEDICDGIQSCIIINMREARYKMRDFISEAEMDKISSGDESYSDPMPTDLL